MTRKKVVVVDYGRGNLNSVSKALEKIGAAVEISSSASALRRAAAVVLPGVGAFGDAMAALRRLKLEGPLRQAAREGKPMLGICLGMQVFFQRSLEYGSHRGLSFFPGTIRRFGADLKVPHMGWNQVRYRRGCPLFKGLPQESNFYFVHSFRARRRGGEEEAGWTKYETEEFTSAVWKDNLFGVQFHPEKSQSAGLKIYSNFWNFALKS